MSRHQARVTAFCMLYQLMEGKNEWPMVQTTLEAAKMNAPESKFAVSLAEGAFSRRFELEQYVIMLSGDKWRYDRLFSVDKVLLHLAMYEMKYGENAPAPVVINEALDIAHKYGSDESPAFINAVLDAFRDKVLEQNLPEYQIDWDKLAERQQELAAADAALAAEQAAKELAEQEAAVVEQSRFAATPIADEMGKRAFRKISRAERTEADAIQPEAEDEMDDYTPRAYRRWSTDEERILAAEAARERRADRGSARIGERPAGRQDRPQGGDRKFDGGKKFDGTKKFSGKKFGDKKFGDKKFGDKKFGDKKFGDRKFDRKFDDKKKFDKDGK